MEEFIRSITLERGRSEDSSGPFRVTFSMLLSDAALLLFSLLLGSYSPFDGVSPFGAACVLAAWYSGLDPYSACIGAVIGYFISGNYAYGSACLLMGFGILFANSFWKIRRIFRLLLAFSAEALLNAVFALIFGKNVLLFVGSSTVSVLGAVVIGNGLRSLRSVVGGRTASDAEFMTLAALAGLISLSLGKLSVFGQSPAVIFSCVCALFSAYRLGMPAVAASVAVGAGHALAVGGDMHFIAVIAAVTLVAASVRSLGKWAVLLAFALSSVFIALMLEGNGVIGYWECGAACLIFAAVPKKLYMKKAESACPRDPRYSRLQYRVASLSEVLSELARVCGGEEGRLLGGISGSLKRSLSAGIGDGARRISVDCRAAAGGKHGSASSGDSYAVRELDGSLLIALSDGMGSGEAAKKESRAAVALLSDLMKVGFSLEDAAGCVNSLLARRSSGDMYATLDVLLVDLSDGTAHIKKHGAPESMILRGGKPILLGAEALPVGVLSDAAGDVRSIALSPGDRVVMMSDGVSDALGEELVPSVEEIMSRHPDASRAAEALLKAASEGGAEDDMTVIVANIDGVTRKSR